MPMDPLPPVTPDPFAAGVHPATQGNDKATSHERQAHNVTPRIDFDAISRQADLTGYDPLRDDDPLDTEVALLESALSSGQRVVYDRTFAHFAEDAESDGILRSHNRRQEMRRTFIWAMLDKERPNVDEMFDRLTGAGHLDAGTWFQVFMEQVR